MSRRPFKIRLDARVVDVVNNRTFVAELENGHRVVAWRPAAAAPGGGPRVGDRVVVEVRPEDMDHGRLVGRPVSESGESVP